MAITLSLYAWNCPAQAPDWLWAMNTRATQLYDEGCGLSASPSGYIYIDGRIAGTVTLGGQTVTAPATNMFMGKFDGAGNFSWLSTHYYSSGIDYCWAIGRDNADNTYASGTVGSGSGNYIIKYDNAGNMVWSSTIGASGGYGFAPDNAGSVFTIGSYNGSLTLGSTTLSAPGGAGVYLAKMDAATGSFLWAKGPTVTGGSISGRGVVLDHAGNIYICGSYTGTPVFGSGVTVPAATGYANIYIAKYDASGNVQWVTTAANAGLNNGDYATKIGLMTDSCGNLYISGYFKGTATFGSRSVTSAGGLDIFAAKCLANGQWEWVQRGGGPEDDVCGGLALDRYFDVYVTGYYRNTATFGSRSVTSQGSNDLFVAKYANATGDFQWVQTAGGSGDQNAYTLTIDTIGFVYVTGSFNGTCNFAGATPPSVTAPGSGDVLLAKLDTLPARQILPRLVPDYCTGRIIALPFDVKGTFNAGNTFTAQLSDANGSFVTPVNIGSVNGTGSGVINITIPPGTTPGSNYIIRIISSSPAYSSYDYCVRVSVIGPCEPVILNGDSTTLDTVHCYADVNKEIIGIPGGGTFSGCGIVSMGGRWYFNPAQASSGAVTWPHQCRIVYRLPGGDSASRVMTVQEPVVVDLGRDTAGCDGDTLTLQSAVSYTNATYQWNTGAGTPSLRAGSSGNYWLEVTKNGCTGRDTISVTIAPRPAVSLGNDTSLCDRDIPLTLFSPQPAGTQYLWSTGLSTPAIEVTRTDTYWLEATLGDCKGSDTIMVKVIPTPSIHIGNDSFICEGQPADIGDAIPGATYLWNTGGTTSSIAVPESGSYWMTADLEGCKVSDTVLITVTPLPAPDLGPDGDICPGQVIVLDASDTHYPVSSYRWNTGDTASSLPVKDAGTYRVEVTSPYNCKGYDTVTFTYHPLPTVLLGDDTTVCEETPLVLNAFSVNSDSLRWSDGSVGYSLTITEGGVYIVSGINKCGETRDTISIKQIFCDIWVPNAFTPNGDGVNDVFRVLGNTGRLESFRLRVFNRWGQLLFETSDRRKGWDGRQQGGEAQLGAYVYMLEYSLNDQPVLQKGNFTLLR